MTGPRLVVPIRDFDGYTRLRSVLVSAQRRTLAIELADRLLNAAAGGRMYVSVVSGDPDVRTWAQDRGVEWIEDPGRGLDAACASGIAGSDWWVVAHADLPGMDAAMLTQITDLARTGTVIVPSADGGTNVIGGTEPIRFSFGPGSFHRHLAADPRATVLVSPRAVIEIDTPNHLRWLPTHWLPSSLDVHERHVQRAP